MVATMRPRGASSSLANLASSMGGSLPLDQDLQHRTSRAPGELESAVAQRPVVGRAFLPVTCRAPFGIDSMKAVAALADTRESAP
jgi:hypothetical protein